MGSEMKEKGCRHGPGSRLEHVERVTPSKPVGGGKVKGGVCYRGELLEKEKGKAFRR